MTYATNRYSANPARQAETQRAESWSWYSVETPSVFREYKLPAEGPKTPQQRREYNKLVALAERHGTSIHVSGFRRG